jgi:hypothetical protein
MLRTILITFWLALHPVHVTLMSADYSSEDKGFKIFIKVYYDDFLKDFSILKGNPPVPDLSKPDQASGSKISEYLKQRVQLVAGKTDLPFELIDFNMVENELKMNLFCRMKKSERVFVVRNSILADVYKDQQNLVIFNYGSFEEGIKLTPEKREYSFVVKK